VHAKGIGRSVRRKNALEERAERPADLPRITGRKGGGVWGYITTKIACW